MKQIKWLWTMKKPQKPLIWDTFGVTNKHSHKYFEIPFAMENTKIVEGDIYFDEELVDAVRDAIREKIRQDINYPSKIAKKLYGLEKEAFSKTGKVRNMNLNELSNEELLKLFDECFFQIGLIECFMSFRGTVQLSDVLTEIIKQTLASKLNKQDKLELLDQFFLLLSIPKKESYMIRLQNEILRICSLIQKGKTKEKIEQEIKKLHGEYSWTGCVMFDGEHVNIEKFGEEINSKLNLNCKAELEKQEKERIQREQKIKELIEELEFNEEEKIHLENLRDWYFLRTYAKDNVSKAIADAMLILYEIAIRKDMNRNDMGFLRKKEIDDIFQIPKERLMQIIGERKEGWGATALGDKIDIFVGEDISEIEEISEEDLNVNEIKGTIASQGIVKGVVRYLKDATELSKIKKGEILVTSMTTTDFTPILDKISGLVTDEGGLTCHAAIVSRELGIPCIVGTRIATKVLKTGDHILLDAEKGIVKKI